MTAMLLAAALMAPASIGAWGMDVHRMLTRRAIDGLPLEIRPFFQSQRDFIGEHSADPDLWRVVGLRNERGAEDPNHYLDIDGLGEPPPFRGVPHDWTAYVAKYGQQAADRNGWLPWRVGEMFDRLVAAFRDIGRPDRPYAADNARYIAAVLAHYVEDAHQPFHATANHDGQLTGQRGIHARFETALVLRNLDRLTLAPVRVTPIADAVGFVFAQLVESQSLVAPLLDADRRAASAHSGYDDAYYAAFFDGARTILERRLSDSASGVASVIAAAWTRAGKPKLPGADPRPARRPAR